MKKSMLFIIDDLQVKKTLRDIDLHNEVQWTKLLKHLFCMQMKVFKWEKFLKLTFSLSASTIPKKSIINVFSNAFVSLFADLSSMYLILRLHKCFRKNFTNWISKPGAKRLIYMVIKVKDELPKEHMGYFFLVTLLLVILSKHLLCLPRNTLTLVHLANALISIICFKVTLPLRIMQYVIHE